MTRRKEIKGIASGLYGSFISRNNDVGGYWGIGKLCLLAKQRKTTIVELNLLAQTISPESLLFAEMFVGYRNFLQKHLAARNIQPSMLTSAKIELNFNPSDRPEKYVPVMSRGKLFKLSVVIIDGRSKVHAVSGYSHCEPHNPNRESQSVRVHQN
ncbi:MAG: hypothetical protein FWG81_01025 [Betaproteobacteria bacterium]|nr:hypothetical protein [Betaproteobacteria bacterium]